MPSPSVTNSPTMHLVRKVRMCGGPVSRTTSKWTVMLRFSADSCTSEIGDLSSSSPASESDAAEDDDAGAAADAAEDCVGVGVLAASCLLAAGVTAVSLATAAAAAEEPGTKGSEAGLSVVEDVDEDDGEVSEGFSEGVEDGKAFAATSGLLWK